MVDSFFIYLNNLGANFYLALYSSLLILEVRIRVDFWGLLEYCRKWRCIVNIERISNGLYFGFSNWTFRVFSHQNPFLFNLSCAWNRSSLIFYKDVSALFTLGELQPYAYHTRLKFA
jgi:hypothetical protein